MPAGRTVLLWHFDTFFSSFIQGVLEVLEFRITRYSILKQWIKLSNCQQHAGEEEYNSPSHFQATIPDDTPRHFCLSKASLIGFEMDYPNQTVNLRHIASVDR